MIAASVIEREIRAQKRIISRLKHEIFGVDKTGKSSYIKEFNSEFDRYERICRVEEVIERAAVSDIVYFGDYHPLDASQGMVLRLMKGLTDRGKSVVLALEMLYIHQQELLDQWMKGKLSEEEFLEAIEYQSEWGFSWESYRRIFTLAKDPLVPIFGIDSEPRDNLRYIRRRDRMIARRLESIRSFFPGHIILVVIGESHLASKHLPSEVRKVGADGFRETIITQNVDEIYWSLLKRGKEDVEAVKIDDVRYCVFTTSPILKYQSYREIIDLWVEGEERDRQTPVLLEMVDNILLFLYGETGKLEVTVNGSLTERLDDVFPEVRYGRTYKSFSSYLRSRKVSHFVEAEVLENLKKIGISYVPAINNFLVLRFDPVGAAQEAARFVVYAMRDRIARKSDSKDRVRPDDRFYAFVLEEALVCLGSKVINPTQDCYRTDLLLGSIDTRGVVRRPVSSFSLEETREIVRLLKYHFRREVKAKGTLKITRKLREIHNLGVRKRSLVAKTLGHMLGEAIYHSFHGGLVSRTDVIDLYRETFEVPGKAKVLYMNWVRKTKPFRGGWGKRR